MWETVGQGAGGRRTKQEVERNVAGQRTFKEGDRGQKRG